MLYEIYGTQVLNILMEYCLEYLCAESCKQNGVCSHDSNSAKILEQCEIKTLVGENRGCKDMA